MGLILDIPEGNRILKEVTTYTTWAMLDDDPDVKQFLLERILLSLGIGLDNIRGQMHAAVGKMPDYYADIEKSIERIQV